MDGRARIGIMIRFIGMGHSRGCGRSLDSAVEVWNIHGRASDGNQAIKVNLVDDVTVGQLRPPALERDGTLLLSAVARVAVNLHRKYNRCVTNYFTPSLFSFFFTSLIIDGNGIVF